MITNSLYANKPRLTKKNRFGYIPQALALCVLIGSAGKNFDTSAVSVGDSRTINANRCSFFALVFSSIIGFSAISADFYIYYPKNYPKWITFATTWSGIWLALIFCNIIGIGIATGVPNIPEWSDAYGVSSGALLYACYSGLGGFGGFCVVILSLGSITQNAPCAYSAALTIQVLGRYAKKVPRWLWCILISVVEVSFSSSIPQSSSCLSLFRKTLISCIAACPLRRRSQRALHRLPEFPPANGLLDLSLDYHRS